MKPLWLITWLLILPGWNDGPLRRAEQAYLAGRYPESIDAYLLAIEAYPLRSQDIRYHIAQCYERMDSTDRALAYYHQSVNTRKPELAARASNQIGLILLRQEKPRQALSAWRQALKYDPDNEVVRYNYELLLKRLRPEEVDAPSPPDAALPDENEAPGAEEDAPASEAERQERRQRIARWLKQFRQSPARDDAARPTPADTLTVGQAREILDLMREDETKFLQQLRKTAPNANRPKERPDW